MSKTKADAVEIRSFADIPIWRRVIRILLTLAFFVAVIFVPAGRWDWVEAWVLLLFFISYLTGWSLWIRRRDPGLWKERTSTASNVERWDKLIVSVYGVLLCALFVVAGLDAVRFEWSSVSIGVRVLGWCFLLAALVLISWVLAENTYASRYVRIQNDRQHQVISTGPYRYVRHPMYVGVILWALGVPLILGSTWALVPSVLIIALFFVRTALEDRTLQNGLPGYKEYAERVRHRLIPAVW
jgi:protein-S-isoprenylcysteine O-methyltransferase Ste14